jgi:hypothetical protein
MILLPLKQLLRDFGLMFHGWRKAAAPLAIVLGPFVIIIAILRNWHGWAPPPFWLDDYAAGVALLAAGIVAIQDQGSLKGRLLSAAFALGVGVMWGSVFEPLAGLHPGPREWSATPLTSRALTLAGLVAALAGLVLSLPSSRPPFIGTRPEPEKRKGRR